MGEEKGIMGMLRCWRTGCSCERWCRQASARYVGTMLPPIAWQVDTIELRVEPRPVCKTSLKTSSAKRTHLWKRSCQAVGARKVREKFPHIPVAVGVG